MSPSLAGDVTTPILVAQSPHIHFVDNAAPVHPRVLPGAVAGDYVVAWTTSAAARKPTLKWGTQSGSYPNVAVATTAQLPIGALCGPPATTTGFMDLGVTASVALHGLASVYAGLRIHYILADGDGRVSGDFSFVVPAPPGAPDYPYRFSAFGDMGRGSFDDGITWREYGQPSRNSALYLAADVSGPTPPSFVHHFGDISYACGFLQVGAVYLSIAYLSHSRIASDA